MRALVFAVAVCLAPAPSWARPNPNSPSTYDQAKQSVHQFLGTERSNPSTPAAQIADQVDLAMQAPERQIIDLAGGGRIIAGCQPSSCQSRAAVLLSDDGAVFAVALIGTSCRTAPIAQREWFPKTQCDEPAHLTILAHSEQLERALIDPLLDWAKHYVPVSSFEVRLIG